MAPEIKLISTLLFLLIAVATPFSNIPAYCAYFSIIWLALILAKIPPLTVVKRSLIEIPFIAFALLMPFFGQGERVEFLGLLLYQEGIEAGVGIIAKATLGVLTAILLSATTTAREILRGLEILKLPTLLVQIASFMLRYLNVVTDEMERMRVARASRGFQETGIKHWKVLANSAGALFIRSYERGERVHLAMLSRGYTGTLPKIERVSVAKSQILYGLSLPLSAGLCLLISISI
ncbi:MAG: cobalt ECF transporter T component CbiQ [Actinobacteria bacterium]|nr:cobalt ECF transporter T component CbiQ [Actinomycetota bacterium]NBP21814.1 cobalt ECF transporter T component CbiQ [Actinomycetota bacterium]NBY50500.1 cobalt ECF transporter T component CbiQ [Actinomycetota bacterium]NCY10565.1 cobalt ECF transporter T component CbiQ [Actinomycetota bacterium]NDA57710.1 cobalt ECF transporter T component CbiQ [Actinomycetota bacterium]